MTPVYLTTVRRRWFGDLSPILIQEIIRNLPGESS